MIPWEISEKWKINNSCLHPDPDLHQNLILCNPSQTQTNQTTDRGENTTCLSEVITNSTQLIMYTNIKHSKKVLFWNNSQQLSLIQGTRNF